MCSSLAERKPSLLESNRQIWTKTRVSFTQVTYMTIVWMLMLKHLATLLLKNLATSSPCSQHRIVTPPSVLIKITSCYRNIHYQQVCFFNWTKYHKLFTNVYLPVLMNIFNNITFWFTTIVFTGQILLYVLILWIDNVIWYKVINHAHVQILVENK